MPRCPRKSGTLLFVLFTAGSLIAGSHAAEKNSPDRIAELIQRSNHRITQKQREDEAIRAAAERKTHPTYRAVPTPGGQPEYFGIYPNYANSPLPTVSGSTITGGIRKFVTRIPGLGAAQANELGQYLPVATPDTLTYPGSDYYEIDLVQYRERLHPDLPATGTLLRGYVQVNNGTNPATQQNTVAPAPTHYLGPMIIARRDRPVRVKFTNRLPTGSGGNLFLPVDTTDKGAGEGPLGGNYTQNRAVIHLHGGITPWISDGTPHQWITPAGEVTVYPKGVSAQNVPDMPDPGPGSQTFFYTNQQGARLMFYHDHTYGITRLNVYAGEAAGYLLTDSVEDQLIDTGKIPGAGEGVNRYGIPLIIEDKTFVPDTAALSAQDPTWNTPIFGGLGNLWFPHVYMTNQNPNVDSGANPMGRWDYGPWFWPPVTTLTHMPVIGNGTNGCDVGLQCPATPNPSLVPEAFMDTPVINGNAYPYMNVQRKAYRFRILNASNDRTLNLQLYYSDSGTPQTDPLPTEVKMVPAIPHSSRSIPPLCNSALTTHCWPTTWPTDGRDGGVPDPLSAGPEMIQIGTEGGFLPSPVVLPNTPIGYDYNRRSITVLNVTNKTLLLGPAERADVIVDFSDVPAGSRIILYNDSPAPIPGLDPRYDYYTGDPDLTSTGGAPTTLVGYGPNIRTLLQFRVSGNRVTPPFNISALQNAFSSTSTNRGAFSVSQPPPIVPEVAYGSAYNRNFTNTYSRIQSNSLTFTPINSGTPVTLNLEPKAIQELFELNYGRMNSTLGVELPFTSFNNQTTIPLGYTDPITENLTSSVTQLWKVTHNGVDTHAIHFHLFNVQLINRVGWDGSIRPPDPNELGWKDTVRMNPLEDAIVALTPVAPDIPFRVPNSSRPLDVTAPVGSIIFVTDPATGNTIPFLNDPLNFGWEYVWHCHLLGHEENDMMRPITLAVATTIPTSPTLLTGARLGTQVNLSWSDTSSDEDGFRIERAVGAGPFSVLGRVYANETSFTDITATPGHSYSYRVFAFNAAGDSGLPTNTFTLNLR